MTSIKREEVLALIALVLLIPSANYLADTLTDIVIFIGRLACPL